MRNSPDAVLPAAGDVPALGEGKRGADGHLGYLLRQAAHVHRQRVEAVLTELDLTAAQFSALVMLEAYPAQSGAELARLALLTPQTMSTIISNLLKAGLVARRPHAVHGRIQQIVLTPPGEARLSAAKARVYGLEPGLLAGLSPDEERIIRHWLAGIAAGT